MLALLLLFVGVPALELALLIEVGSRIGVGWTLLLVVATGVLGASLARAQGLAVMSQLTERLARGEAPTTELLEGALVLVAGGALLAPGFVTDLVGLLCLLPFTRHVMLRLLIAGVRRRAARGGRGGVSLRWMERDAEGRWRGATSDSPPRRAPGAGAGPLGPGERIKDVPYEVTDPEPPP